MRALPLILALFPSVLWADDIPISSDVSAVTIYPQGATVTRVVPFSAPPGQHDLILTDMPLRTALSSIRVDVVGAQMGGITARNSFIAPGDPVQDAAIAAAEAEIERLEQVLRDQQADVREIGLEAEAAQARVDFLTQMGEGKDTAQLDIAALRDLLRLIGEETLSAKRDAHDAVIRAEAASRAQKETRDALQDARAVLNALVPEKDARARLAVAISGDAPMQGTMTVTYTVQQAAWRPIYDLRLDRADKTLTLDRGAFVVQQTGENWQGVDLVLSTARPSEQTMPTDIWPEQRWIVEEAEERYDAPLASVEAPMMEEPVIVADMASAGKRIVAAANFDGLSVTYTYPEPVAIASGADNVRLALDTLSTQATLVAEAVPLWDNTAFLMAAFTNDMGELILPSSEANFYLDGTYQGQRAIDTIAAGAEAELAFGPIEGLRLNRTVLDRQQGDSGVITRSNDLTEKVRIEIENLTGETWPVRVLDRVPYSEQEDLEISWTAQPRPTEQNVDDKRGVLAWSFELPGGETREIRLNSDLEWPDGMILR